jgi:glucosamine 6-phosphate synthetase-like amidotransferase/phosphosugar isomerase protein
MFTRSTTLKRHILTRCKVKKLKDEEKENKENIMNKQIQKITEDNKRLVETNKKIIKINKDYKNDILELEKKVNLSINSPRIQNAIPRS